MFGPAPNDFHLNSTSAVALLANLKRPKASEYAPTPPASPTKKRVRASVDIIDTPSLCLPGNSPDREIPSWPTTPQLRTPSPTPCSVSTHGQSSTNLDDEDISIEHRLPAEVENSTYINVPLRQADPIKLKNSKLTSIWSIKSQEEKEAWRHREFAELIDDAETQAMNLAHSQRLKLSQKRAVNRERQQKHREIVRAKKIEEGWVPGKKCVRLTLWCK